MTTGAPLPDRLPSMVGLTLRRSFVTGRILILVSTGYAVGLTAILSQTSSSSFTSSVPLLLPLFGSLAAMGGLTVFTADRVKGVLEYLLAYGFTPQRLFTDILLASLALTAIVVGGAIGVGLALFHARGHAISTAFAAALGLYAIPMGFATAAFAVTVGMYWTSVSSPRTGISSPVGLAPLIGIAPSLVTLVLAALLSEWAVYIVEGAVLVVVAVVVGLLASAGRLLRRERLLSPA